MAMLGYGFCSVLGYEAAVEYIDPMPSLGYDSAARRAGSQSANSCPVTGSVIDPEVVPEDETAAELARLLALKLRLAEDGGGPDGGATEPAPLLLLPLFPLPMGGLTAIAGLTAAEWLSVAGAAPGVEAPPDEERQRAVVPPTGVLELLAAPLLPPGLVMVAEGEMSPLGVGDVTPTS